MEAANTLLILPCCAAKAPAGDPWYRFSQALSDYVEPSVYSALLQGRRSVLESVRKESRYTTDNYARNLGIRLGPDFGGDDRTGAYLSAIDRYLGSLYTAEPNLSRHMRESIVLGRSPHVLILSALYGPLHPLDLIQDYNLKMSDRPAYGTWRSVFPSFLDRYVRRNAVTDIRLYLGGSTKYLEVAALAARPLLQRGIVKRVVQYEVVNGNSYHTPHIHGLLLAEHLGVATASSRKRDVVEVSL